MKVEIYKDEAFPYYGIISKHFSKDALKPIIEVTEEFWDDFNEAEKTMWEFQEKLRKRYKKAIEKKKVTPKKESNKERKE